MSQANETLHLRTLCELRAGLRDGEFSAIELTEALLSRIENAGSELNAFITLTGERALAAAGDADKALSQGDSRPLTGRFNPGAP